MTTSPLPPELALEQQPFAVEHVDELLEHVDELLEPSTTPEHFEQPLPPMLAAVRAWSVTDDGSAEWAMRMLAAIEVERRGLEEQYDLWLQRVRDARDEALRPIERRLSFFDGHLRMYGIRVRADDPRRATITLPSGKIATKQPSKPTVEVANEEEFIQWAGESLPAEEYERAVQTKAKAMIGEIRKLVRVDATEVAEQTDEGAEVEARTEYSVVWASTGEVVAGLSADLGAPTATATPAL